MTFSARKIDFFPLFIIFGLLLFGLVMVYDASSAEALKSFNDKYHFLKEQAKWLVIGLGVFGLLSVFDYRQYKKLALPALVASLVLLLAVFVPGIGIKIGQPPFEARRWLNLGLTVVQPSEFAKLSLVIYLSAWLISREKGRLPSFLLLIGTMVGLIIAEPDMGTSVVLLGTALTTYFLSESEIIGALFLLPLMIGGGLILALRSTYRLKRVLTFLSPEADPLGAGYQIHQVIIALGSGGLFGLGLGNSRQKYFFLPEAYTDSIIGIIGEEIGLVGLTVLLVALGLFFLRSFQTTLRIEDKFGRLLGLGILSWLGLQTLVNLASMVALIPLTGVPLPFISYGGSALVVELAGLGILVNIWRTNL